MSARAAGDHVIVVDLGYGDAGKGSVVDWLCARPGRGSVSATRPRTVVRFNGGAQAAHNVITSDGRHHAFAQFGSGTFTPGVRTHLSRFVLVDPLALAAEAAHLASVGVGDALDRLRPGNGSEGRPGTGRVAWASERRLTTRSSIPTMRRESVTARSRAG